ncbi:MAG: biosynthetic arginine decarboxylase [Verrucomicrobiae bacterium]|jgi:arginine decarboxylase|nr:biosynthetic arginine decarboxylase [Verrucomicrobiae bacterium]
MSGNSKSNAWSVEDSRNLYHIGRWGADYFDVNDNGHVICRPRRSGGAAVALPDIIEEAKRRGLRFPLLVRFQDILRDRVEALNGAFSKAIADFGYTGRYRGVFPVKVNQLREVVEEILDAGRPFEYGLEVGSKTELFAGLALQDADAGLVICNGYKDPDFVHLALMGTKLGRHVIMVVEKLEELHQIIRVSKEVGVRPLIGIRARLLCKGFGKWAGSAGEDAKFGLSTADMVAAGEILKAEGMEDCFRLLHFHIGSQVPDILTIKKAVQEAGRIYAKLRQMNFPVEYVDCGGGLGIDYDGSRAVFESSTNYTLQEYANDIVYYLADVCNSEKVPHPNIITESGRAIVAHHSVLIVEVFGAIRKYRPSSKMEFGENEHHVTRELLEMRNNFEKFNTLEALHDAKERKDDAFNMFMVGLLGLEDKAKIETLYWQISELVVAAYRGKKHMPEEVREMGHSLGDQYLCNFSVFQSLLDHWALDQLFPIMPLARLQEQPTRETTLVDITCDSDGAINRFIDLEDVSNTLMLHELNDSKDGNGHEPYHLGMFLLGAYQDIMGDLHNLFGRVNELHVFVDPDEPEGYYVEEIITGTTVGMALESVQYDTRELKRQMKVQIDKAVKACRLKPSEGMNLLREFEQGLKTYTYLDFGRRGAGDGK